MATAPVKSQPLHNFSLPLLRWGHKNHINTSHRYRRPSATDPPPLPSAAEHHRSPPPEQDSDGSRSAQRNRFSFASCSSQRQQQEAAGLEGEGNVAAEGESEKEKACDEAKPWNLRPRKAVVKTTAAEIGELPAIVEVEAAENLPKSMRLRGFVVDGQGLMEKKEKKRKLWITLSKEEIEEDVYAMTGMKPARRPKKRPKYMQKQLDNVFPGLYLAEVTVDSYRVHDAQR